jgi:hypothetical protein
VLPLGNQEVVVYGLRGHILSSRDNGANWEPRQNELTTAIMGGIQLARGGVVLAGQGGHFFLSPGRDLDFVTWKPAEFSAGIAALAEAADGASVTVGEAGAVRVKLP